MQYSSKTKVFSFWGKQPGAPYIPSNRGPGVWNAAGLIPVTSALVQVGLKVKLLHNSVQVDVRVGEANKERRGSYMHLINILALTLSPITWFKQNDAAHANILRAENIYAKATVLYKKS